MNYADVPMRITLNTCIKDDTYMDALHVILLNRFKTSLKQRLIMRMTSWFFQYRLNIQSQQQSLKRCLHGI